MGREMGGEGHDDSRKDLSNGQLELPVDFQAQCLPRYEREVRPVFGLLPRTGRIGALEQG